MEKWMMVVSLVTASLLANTSYAEEIPSEQVFEEAQLQPLVTEIPTEEKAFVAVINQFNKTKIVELLGEPARADDVKVKGSGKVVASIWHYHNINTDENGAYYPTTELDFVDDKVVQVVFLNNDGSEANDGAGKKYEMQPMPEMEPLEDIPPS
ncbi:MAG TPA: hypothetical protein VK952_03585 [Methylotenera sp.]|nr:hypothetical protein [Methylotenera sp.]